ncbi:MAG: menaquinone biosynthesis protein [Armatimonadetes bacterium]|nr:menaquinone biosynthesis protein [Armatimonadota bacterium]
MGYRLGCVPYINAVPLVAMFEQSPEFGVEVVYAVPSRLPELLDSGEVDAILVSSYYLLTTPGLRAATSACIGSKGPVASVRLFSKRPFRTVRTLALDASSMTSNALCCLLLKDVYKNVPETSVQPPVLSDMLRDHDAGLLIGDIGMTEPGKGLWKLDLGQAWTKWQGLPFVWALWVGREKLDPCLASMLEIAARSSWMGQEAEADLEARRAAAPTSPEDRPALGPVPEASPRDTHEAYVSEFHRGRSRLAGASGLQQGPERIRSRIVARAVNLSGIDPKTVEDYLVKNMRYRIGTEEAAALQRFGSLLKAAGYPVRPDKIQWVEAPGEAEKATV